MNKTKGSRQLVEVDMLNGPLFGKLVVFVIPVMLSGLLQLLFNAADTVVVGRFAGNESLAAVGSTSSLINLMTNLFIGMSIGSNVAAAHFYGSGQKERVSDTLHTSVALSFIMGVALLVFGETCAKPLLALMGSPDDVIELASIYMRCFFIGIPATTVYNFGAAVLRASGETKRPLYYLMAAGVANVLLNLLFVIGFGMGVAGVGLASAISAYMSCIMLIVFFLRQDGAMHLNIKSLRIDGQIVKNILRVGLPAGIQGTVFSFSNVVIQSTINSFGSVVVAGNAAASSLEGFVYVAMNSVYQATITFTGQNYAARKKNRIIRITLQSLALATAIGLVLGWAVHLTSATLLGIYSTSPEVIELGMVRLSIICTTYFLCGCMDSMVGSLRGIGCSTLPMIMSILGACCLRLLWIATIFKLDPTPRMLYIAYPVTWLVTLTAHVITFLIVFRKITRNW